MNAQMIFDYHTHTTFSRGLTPWTPHGKGSIEENARAAVAAGLRAIAITDHGPGHLTFANRLKNLPEIRKEMARVKELFPNLEIYLSVEANILDGPYSLDVRPDDVSKFDFLIGGYHLAVRNAHVVSNYTLTKGYFVGEDRMRKATVRNTEMMIRALYENNLRILTHPGDKAPVDIVAIAQACAQTDTWMEISNFHSNLTVEEIKLAATTEAKFVISSDAHRPDRVGRFETGLKRALDAGLDLDRIVNITVSQEDKVSK